MFVGRYASRLWSGGRSCSFRFFIATQPQKCLVNYILCLTCVINDGVSQLIYKIVDLSLECSNRLFRSGGWFWTETLTIMKNFYRHDAGLFTFHNLVRSVW